MKRFTTVIVLCFICLTFIGVSQLFAGDPPLPGYEASGKPISATMTVIQTDTETVLLFFGSCKKIPFHFLTFRDAAFFNDLEESDFFDDNGIPQWVQYAVLSECDPSGEASGFAITGFSSWTKDPLDGVIIAECVLEPVVPVKKPLQ